ncbi:hypothetical protein [Pedobacter caeni]|uniref:Uncharacterized protein n=1 Tax=Pedobacter caeni TaxID=288992 RepID=A0A1M5MR64_9SPHI|nr:hypothetical protein [Pedobacter caeni]SHG79542.1 hypothetical protein SAMN04488522_107280 [Pedobacter caeni]
MKKKLFITGILTLFIFQTQAQIAVTADINGIPIETKSNSNIKGSRYLYENWTKGHVLQKDKKYYNDMELKYDVLDDYPIFKKQEKALAFRFPIQEFQLISPKTPTAISIFRNGFPAVGTHNDKSYYQVLADGKTILLKKHNKSIVESTQYGEAKKQEVLTDSQQYYLFHNGEMIKLKADKNALLKALGDKQKELNQFITDQDLKAKSDQQLIKIVNYYNGI